MQSLIDQIRLQLPLEQNGLCQGPCQGCSKKLLEYLDSQLCDQQTRLEQGSTPTFGDIQQLLNSSRRIQKVLIRNGIISP